MLGSRTYAAIPKPAPIAEKPNINDAHTLNARVDLCFLSIFWYQNSFIIKIMSLKIYIFLFLKNSFKACEITWYFLNPVNEQ